MTTSTQHDEHAPVAGAGRLHGVGLGPGDPGLLTLRAVELIGAADVVAYHSAPHGRSIARAIAEPYLRGGERAAAGAADGRPPQIEEPLVYPVTTEGTDHPGGYRAALEEFYTGAARRLAAHLDAGRDVAVLVEGDPMFYSSYMHLHKRLADRYPTEVVPAVTSVNAAAARLGRPLAEGEETLTVIPGTLPPDELEARLAAADSAAVMKLGRTFPAVRRALAATGRLAEARYVERATMEGERSGPLAAVRAESVPYFALALLPSRHTPEAPPEAGRPPAETGADRTASGADRAGTGTACAGTGTDRAGSGTDCAATGAVTVVGLGPGGPRWLTPEARGALTGATDIVGYTTYVRRVPARPGQRRHASDNKVEAERAAFALDLARRGARVAVVSSGDPGVFAMASAVLEAAAEPPFDAVPVRVLPGLTAAQAAASRAGAPLGHDYAVISLSDRLKGWEVVEERLRAAARADLALALYNPASKSRPRQVAAARDVLLEFRGPDTPVVLARAVGAPEEDVRTVRLADLDPLDVDMRCILLVGSSTTRVSARADGTAPVWTPRRYPAPRDEGAARDDR